jgi:signal transduction histidine kinase
MPTKDLGNAETGQAGLNFENFLQAHLACGILTVDSDGKITLTEEAERALHLPEGQHSIASLDALPKPLRTIIEEVRKTGHSVTNCQIVLHADKGETHMLVITALPMPVAKDAAASVVVMLKDVSSAGKLERSLRRLDRLASIGTLSASMAHEIKNAFVAIRAFIDLLLERNSDAELAGTVRRELTRIDAIVSHMLKFSAPAQPAFAPVRLHQILDHSLRLVQHRARHKVISFRREFNAPTDAFRGDDHQMEQVFLNLLLNGVEAIGVEGTLTVSTDLIGAEKVGAVLREGSDFSRLLRVAISDTGPGIPSENVKHIFDPFFTTKPHGTGLGLAVTRRIVEEHQGTIRVESEPGKGTTFVILLPAR